MGWPAGSRPVRPTARRRSTYRTRGGCGCTAVKRAMERLVSGRMAVERHSASFSGGRMGVDQGLAVVLFGILTVIRR